jgi:hypothetical protein
VLVEDRWSILTTFLVDLIVRPCPAWQEGHATKAVKAVIG